MTVLDPRPSHRPAVMPYLLTDAIGSLPILILAPHSRCNCRCLMCDIWRDRRRTELSADEVAGWMDEVRRLGVQRVVLTGGEPLMHSHLWALCDHLRDANIGITLVTTGLLLARDAHDLARVCDDVIVSVDGPARIHDEIRNVPGGFERMRRGIAALRAQPADIRVSGRCTVQRANFSALRETVAAAHALMLDGISFLAADVRTEAFNRPGGWTAERASEVALSPEDLPVLAAELDALEREGVAEFASGYIAESPAKLRRNLLEYFEALHGRRAFTAQSCNAPWVSAVVEADGTVRPCFFHAAIGNVRTAGGLSAVLNTDEARQFRRTLDVATNPTCRACVCRLNLGAADTVERASVSAVGPASMPAGEPALEPTSSPTVQTAALPTVGPASVPASSRHDAVGSGAALGSGARLSASRDEAVL